jgi:hypothetical protein
LSDALAAIGAPARGRVQPSVETVGPAIASCATSCAIVALGSVCAIATRTSVPASSVRNDRVIMRAVAGRQNRTNRSAKNKGPARSKRADPNDNEGPARSKRADPNDNERPEPMGSSYTPALVSHGMTRRAT